MTPFPDPLNDADSVTAEVVLLWARRTILKHEIELFEADIEAYDEKVKKGEEEVTADETEKYEQAKNAVKAAKEEKAVV